MYSLLIRKRSCQAALDFAAIHGLDKDEVLKSQAGPTEDAVKALLAYGPHITDHHRFSEVDDDDSSHDQSAIECYDNANSAAYEDDSHGRDGRHGCLCSDKTGALTATKILLRFLQKEWMLKPLF
ncbi:hypothetical protein KIW84_030391 [Lathyrus oleraceus]|uniref:Uncharacterized protein n=1 Tax=Pisum sativum TaxID=3888 RepID=A0A9D4XSX3_PEA|nr:hypothetical protein KIW84_030391 [Pisum sativum]